MTNPDFPPLPFLHYLECCDADSSLQLADDGAAPAEWFSFFDFFRFFLFLLIPPTAKGGRQVGRDGMTGLIEFSLLEGSLKAFLSRANSLFPFHTA